ncbi:MAG: ABC transporter permease [Candidatus Thorarchaeota archaeon]
MNVRDTFSYSLGAIRLRKLRSGLTTLGIVIGIAAIVALLSFTQGFQVAISSQFQEGLATDVVTVTSGSGTFMFSPDEESDFALYANDTALIDSVEGVLLSSAVSSKQVTAEFDGLEQMLSLTGVNLTAYQEIYSTFVTEFGEIPTSPADNEAIIGHTIYDPWGNGTHPINVGESFNAYYTVRNGTTLVPVNITLTVVGVLEEIGSSAFGPSDTGLYISLGSAMDYFDTEEVSRIVVKLASSDEDFIATVSSSIEELFFGEVTVNSATAILDTMESILGTVEILLAGIGGISLLVAGIGIMNIMIVSLMERTREIGILKALGAKGSSILVIFLGEALIIGIVGGVFGIVVGSILATIFSSGMSPMGGQGPSRFSSSSSLTITPVVTPTLMVMALLFGIVVSVVFATYPAWRASRLMPVDALRSE